MDNEDEPFTWGDYFDYCDMDVIRDLEHWIEDSELDKNELVYALVGFLSDVTFVSLNDPPRQMLVSDLIKIISTSKEFKHILEEELNPSNIA